MERGWSVDWKTSGREVKASLTEHVSACECFCLPIGRESGVRAMFRLMGRCGKEQGVKE